MINDVEDQDLERRMREKLFAPAKQASDDAVETRMIARLLGSQTAKDHFLRSERQKPMEGYRKRYYRPLQIRLKFEYWERRGANPDAGWWCIDRFENGVKVKSHEGADFQKRDQLLIKLQAAGLPVVPITVAEIEPRPILGRAAIRPKPKSKRMAILDQIADLDSDDIADFSLDDWEFEGR